MYSQQRTFKEPRQQWGSGRFIRGPPQQSGEGILSLIKKASKPLKNIARFATGPAGTALRNALPSSDANARPGFAGEKHAILKLPNGRPGVANYMGPGTQIEKRLARGDPPRTLSDKVAKAHDIRYGLGHNFDDIRTADRKMVSSLNAIEKAKGDARVNTQMGKRLIQAKMALEDTGVVKKNAFADFGGIDETKRPLLKQALNSLEQEGFGITPADNLKLLAIRALAKERRRKKRLKGGGYKVPKTPLQLVKMLLSLNSKRVIPTMMKGSGVKVTAQQAARLAFAAHKNVKGKLTPANAARAVAKVLKPLIDSKRKVPMKLGKLVKGITHVYKGSGFWKDFGRGFKKGFNSTLKALAPAALAYGTKDPEFLLRYVPDS